MDNSVSNLMNNLMDNLPGKWATTAGLLLVCFALLAPGAFVEAAPFVLLAAGLFWLFYRQLAHRRRVAGARGTRT